MKKYYYDADDFKLILGDSLKELKKIKSNSIEDLDNGILENLK